MILFPFLFLTTCPLCYAALMTVEVMVLFSQVPEEMLSKYLLKECVQSSLKAIKHCTNVRYNDQHYYILSS